MTKSSGPNAMQLPLTIDAHERPYRDFLTPDEIDRLLAAARKGRHGVRDYAIILMMYRHGMRVSEACSTRIADLSLDSARVWVRRLKGSMSTEQPIEGDELRAIRRYLQTRSLHVPWLFLSERGGPLTRQAVNYLLERAGVRAGLAFKVTPKMLRHSCGYYLSNKGCDARLIQDYLGHRNASHTARYTRTAGARFERLWR